MGVTKKWDTGNSMLQRYGGHVAALEAMGKHLDVSVSFLEAALAFGPEYGNLKDIDRIKPERFHRAHVAWVRESARAAALVLERASEYLEGIGEDGV